MSTLPQNETAATLSFGGFTLNLQRRSLYSDGTRVHLTPKPLDVLIYLVQNRGRLVEKREVLDAVWDGLFVTEDNLVQAIMEIRRALGDNRQDPQFIQTVPRQGYRFVAEVTLDNETEQLPNLASQSPREAFPAASQKMFAHPLKWIAVLALVILFVAGIGFGVRMLFLRGRSVPKPPPFANPQLTRLTSSGKITSAAVSPDGKYVVYALADEGKESLWLKQLPTASDVQISQPQAIQHHALTFSPDANSIYYVVRNQNKLGELYQIPMFGGVAKKVIADIDSEISFSPDGRQICFLRGYPEKAESTLVIANADGSQEKEIASRKGSHSFPTQLDAAPSWSPSGGVIACPEFNAGNADGRMSVIAVDAKSGEFVPIASRRWWFVGEVEWLRDGTGVIMSAKERSTDPTQLWFLSYPNGRARRITSDVNDYVGLSLTHDSVPAILTVQSNVLSSISIAPDQANGTTIPVSSVDSGPGLAWTPTGQIVYTARLKGHQDIQIIEADGGNRRQLTSDAGENNWPSVSADGRYIVFMSNRTGANAIWRINIDGSNPVQLTKGDDARWPRCTPDTQWVVYASLSKTPGVFKVPIDGGDSVQLTTTAPTQSAISADGKLIATGYRMDAGADKTAIYAAAGGVPLSIMNFTSFYMVWQGDNLTYIDQYNRNILSRPVAGGPPRQLTHFTDGQIRAFDWSREGRLACLRRVTIADVVMMRSPESND